MCCEATDALLEYVRRYLRLTGLRNLNAPRRLKLRVPVLKDWLQRQGHAPLAESIPDWDPVRRPTGRWKAWEVQHLKPIMDEKAVERQAKRNLVQGEPLLQITMREQADEGKRQEAIDALSAMGSCGPHLDNDEMPNYANGEAKADGSVVTTSDNFPLLIVDDAAEAAEEAGAGAESSQDEGLTSARAVTHMMVSRVSSARLESEARYRRRLHRIPGETDEERAWQERCWKLPQHGGYVPGFVEAEGMVWDEDTFAFRKVKVK